MICSGDRLSFSPDMCPASFKLVREMGSGLACQTRPRIFPPPPSACPFSGLLSPKIIDAGGPKPLARKKVDDREGEGGGDWRSTARRLLHSLAGSLASWPGKLREVAHGVDRRQRPRPR